VSAIDALPLRAWASLIGSRADRRRAAASATIRGSRSLADAQEYVHPGPPFDAVVSLLEYVERDRRMLISVHGVRRPGPLILEVPLAMRRPFAQPHNPHHLREYSREEIERLVSDAGFALTGARGMSRGIYTDDPALAREAIQLHARKPDAVMWGHEPAERAIQEEASIMRRLVLESIATAGSGHPGGSLSCIEILACLYFEPGGMRVGTRTARSQSLRVVEGPRVSGVVCTRSTGAG
jgi:hypothetical protein